MEVTLLAVVIALFVAVLVIKSVLSLLVRYALFVAVALLAFTHERGPDIRGWLGGEEAVQVALVAGAAMVGTGLVSALLLRRARFRALLVPLVGVGLTVLAMRVLTGQPRPLDELSRLRYHETEREGAAWPSRAVSTGTGSPTRTRGGSTASSASCPAASSTAS